MYLQLYETNNNQYLKQKTKLPKEIMGWIIRRETLNIMNI